MRRTLLVVPFVLGLVLAGTFASASTTPLSIAISGNHFVNGDGQTVQLHGVNIPSTAYACDQGYGYGYIDPAQQASLIASWHANVARVTLNEDCWLGINGEPHTAGGCGCGTLTKAGYVAYISELVSDLEAKGIYVLLDLHFSAPGADTADDQRSMPDDHTAAFWTSVATHFLTDHAVLFGVFNEPVPAAGGWACWKNGGCAVTRNQEGNVGATRTGTYTAVGMQALVSAIRAVHSGTTYATHPIVVGGVNFSGDLTQWLANAPTDTAGQLAADFHAYLGPGHCQDTACWDAQIAPVAAQVPVVTGEFGDDTCPLADGNQPDEFDNVYFTWADAHGVSYLAWGFYWTGAVNCSTFQLLDQNNDPIQPNGVATFNHYTALFNAPPPVATTTTTDTGSPTTTTPPMTTEPTTDSVPTSPPPAGVTPAPRITRSSVTLHHRRLRVTLVVPAAVTGRLRIVVHARRNRHALILTLRPRINAGRARAAITLPKGTTIRRIDVSGGNPKLQPARLGLRARGAPGSRR